MSKDLKMMNDKANENQKIYEQLANKLNLKLQTQVSSNYSETSLIQLSEGILGGYVDLTQSYHEEKSNTSNWVHGIDEENQSIPNKCVNVKCDYRMKVNYLNVNNACLGSINEVNKEITSNSDETSISFNRNLSEILSSRSTSSMPRNSRPISNFIVLQDNDD